MKRTGTRFRQRLAQDNYDAIIIGSGIGGLTTAALLSKLGKRVCVLEQHYTAGGYTHSYEREGYEWDVGVHYIGEVHKPWSVIRRVFDVISDGNLHWAPMDDHYDRIVLGEQFELNLGAADFHALSVQFLDGEAGAILVILAQMGLRAGHWRDMAELDHDFGLADRRGRRCRRLRLLLLATGGQRKGGNNGEGNNGKLRAHRYFS